MNPDSIELESMAKQFEYEKHAREVDSCSDIEQLKSISKAFIKLYLKQQETLTKSF